MDTLIHWSTAIATEATLLLHVLERPHRQYYGVGILESPTAEASRA